MALCHRLPYWEQQTRIWLGAKLDPMSALRYLNLNLLPNTNFLTSNSKISNTSRQRMIGRGIWISQRLAIFLLDCTSIHCCFNCAALSKFGGSTAFPLAVSLFYSIYSPLDVSPLAFSQALSSNQNTNTMSSHSLYSTQILFFSFLMSFHII